MRINLSDPEAVWAVANPILTQPNAVAIFAQAWQRLPADGLPTTQLHRIRLGMCHGLALFATNQIDSSLAVVQATLLQSAQMPLPVAHKQPPITIDTEAGLTLLRQTLAALAAQGLTAFATAGVLLGLVREGRLLPNDKDLDVVVPIQQLQAAAQALPALGWRPAWTAVKAVNFQSFVHTQHAITLDLFGYDMDAAQACMWGGWWPVGLPREQGRLLRFEATELVLTDLPWSRHWGIRHPEAYLAQMYGPNWRTPDAEFDRTMETPALVAHTAYTRTWGALRVLEAWVQGQTQMVSRRLHTLARLDAADPVVHAFAPAQARPAPYSTRPC